VQGLGIGPDVSHTVNLSLEKTEGNGVGEQKEPPVCVKRLNVDQKATKSGLAEPESVQLSIITAKSGGSVIKGRAGNGFAGQQQGQSLSSAVQRLTFESRLADEVSFSWQTLLVDRKKLFVFVPDKLLQHGSRDSFVSLLEYAESILKCSHIIVYFKKDRKDMSSVMRLFMYFGFTLLKPGQSLIAASSSDMLYMAYSVDLDADGYDDDSDD